MSLPERAKRFEQAEAAPTAKRPKIWIEGQQRPKFDIKAYFAASLGMARRDLAPEILDAERRLRSLGARMESGELRLNLAWAGPVARVVPSHLAAGRWIVGLADLFAGSHAILVPVEGVAGALAYPEIARLRGRSAQMGPKVADERIEVLRPIAPDQPTLDAIRSAIRLPPQEARLDQTRRSQSPHAPEVAVPAVAPGDGLLARSAQLAKATGCRALLGILMAFAIPGGAVRAMLFHLNNGDLNDWS